MLNVQEGSSVYGWLVDPGLSVWYVAGLFYPLRSAALTAVLLSLLAQVSPVELSLG